MTMDFPPQVTVTTETNPHNGYTWEPRQHPRVRFQTMSGPVDAWIDRDGYLQLQGERPLVLVTDGQLGIKLRTV